MLPVPATADTMDPESQLTSPEPDLAEADSSANRRKSGRATRKPELFSQNYSSQNGATPGKRKRNATGDDNDEDEDSEGHAEDIDDASDSEDDVSNDEPDEEELREKKRAARRASAKKAASGSKPKAKSRAAKKPRFVENGTGNQLAFRPAPSGRKVVSRPRKPKVRPSLAAGERGLYGMLVALPSPQAFVRGI